MVRVEKGPGSAGSARKGVNGAVVPSRCGSTQRMASNVKVVVRVRPMNEKELERHGRVIVDVVDDKMLVFDPKEEVQPFFYQGVQQPRQGYLKRPNKELKFVFDHVCGQEACNNDVFEIATKEMMGSLMEGYNCSVFVYGATGAGKTFTMIGNSENPGITYLTMEHLFYTINSFENDREFDIGVSYLEVYNENVYDLIKPSKTPLQLREDTKYGVMVAGLTLHNIKTARELLNMLENGNKNRTQHPTDANAESSRSHAVFQVYIKMSYKTSSQVRIVKLSMIDLAGSERASATGCVGERFKEGANINKSLLSLANCINRLADGSSYIPYRDSKLTRLLKDSLGGNCKTVMIANVSPAISSYEDTYNTLKYAARANKIQLTIKKNIVDGDIRTSQYVKMNEELKKKVKELETRLAQRDDGRLAQALKANEELKKKLKDMEIKLNTTTAQKNDKENKIEELKRKLKELQAKLSLSSIRVDSAKEEAKQDWRQRIQEADSLVNEIEDELLSLMSRQRVLALRHRLRTRAFSHVVEMAHRSSSEAMDQMCTEDIPRQERAVEHYSKQAMQLDLKIMTMRSKWEEAKKQLDRLTSHALADCPDIEDFIAKLQVQRELRHTQARDELRHKLLLIENDEIHAFTEYMSEMPNMLKKLYMILKGYNRATPALTDEYLEIMKKAKSAKGITWCDKGSNTDAHFKYICNLDLESLSMPDYGMRTGESQSVDVATDSEDLTDMENREPVFSSGKKRKGTPIKMYNNETIIINDSLDDLDVTKSVSASKRLKRELTYDVENCGLIQPKDLNSTFDLAENMEALKKTFKSDIVKTNQPVKKELADRTNTMARSINFNSRAVVAKPVLPKPAVGRALPQRRPVTAPVAPRAGFGSSVGRDGTPLARNNNQNQVGWFKSSEERADTHASLFQTSPCAEKMTCNDEIDLRELPLTEDERLTKLASSWATMAM